MNKKEPTLVVTDSGLGGLSVFAGLASRLEKSSWFEKVHLIYFNAWPLPDRGYNHFPHMEARAKVFNSALEAMAKIIPDAILIACNTLSVIYPFTQFSRITAIPVTGIVAHGVDLMQEALIQDPESRVIIFGTPATIEDGSHQKNLIALGIHPDRIITQGCINLAGKIERDPFSQQVGQMIHANAREAAGKLGPFTGRLFAALCCTHFGYCQDQFMAALASHTLARITLLNPNLPMAEAAITKACQNFGGKSRPDESPGPGPKPSTDPSPVIEMKILSRVLWEPSRIKAYERLLTPVSPLTVKALKHYTWNPELFQVNV